MENYCVNYRESNSSARLKGFLSQIFNGKVPVVLCIGTDAVSGDSLGPLTGSLLQNKLLGKTLVLGNMNYPVTAKEIPFVAEFLKDVFPSSPILAIDAALGQKEDIGALKILNAPVKPGLGVNKNLAPLGTQSLIAVVEEKSGNKNLLSSVRLSLVYSLAEIISSAVSEYVLDCYDRYCLFEKKKYQDVYGQSREKHPDNQLIG